MVSSLYIYSWPQETHRGSLSSLPPCWNVTDHATGAFVPNSGTRVSPTQYSAQPSSWVPQTTQVRFQGILPTSNPMPEADPNWQSHVSAHHPRRALPQHAPHGFPQPISWSRNESSDSDYDSAYGNEGRHAGSPVGVYPDQMHNYMMHSQIPRPGKQPGILCLSQLLIQQKELCGKHLQAALDRALHMKHISNCQICQTYHKFQQPDLTILDSTL
jgi:hypothetical protein